MRCVSALSLASSLLIVAPPVADASTGVVSMNWDTCTGPLDSHWGGPGSYAIFVSVQGADQPHQAYRVWVLYGDASQAVPDAWRFDAAGCQGSAFVSIDHAAPPVYSKACPSFMGASAPSLQVKNVDFSPASEPYPTTLMRVLLTNLYPNGVTTVNSAVRYFLARFAFNHTDSVEGAGEPGVTCGGVGTPMWFTLVEASWTDLNGAEHPFDRAAPSVSVTWNVEVEARPTTWGGLKAQYR